MIFVNLVKITLDIIRYLYRLLTGFVGIQIIKSYDSNIDNLCRFVF